MFAFHETTRKRLCRTAFVILCVAPTLATAAWIVDRRLPSRAATQAARLGGLLQVHAELAGYREPRPGSRRCDALTLADSTTARPLMKLESPRIHGGAGAWSISAETATVDADELSALAPKVAAWLALPELQAVELRIRQFSINLPAVAGRSARPEFMLGDVQARFDRDATGVARLRLAIRPPNSPADDKAPVRLTVERSTASPGASIRALLETPATPLPASALAAVVPGFNGLNAEATLTGTVEWTIDHAGVAGVAKGRLDDVAIASLLPVGSPHAAKGLATVTLSQWRWRGDRLERLQGAATADDVQLSASLVAAAAKYLYCAEVADGVAVAGTAPMIAIDRLACHFVLDHRGLTLSGDLPQSVAAPTGCLATSRREPLLLQPPYVDIPAGAWVQFVAGPASSWLPATHAAVRMAQRLPLP